jgi:hypothetical protein
MRKIITILLASGFIVGLAGASLARADTNTNTNTPNCKTWGCIKCLYGPNPNNCAGTPQPIQIPDNPDEKTIG